ncbi:MAG: hypothetical protein EXS24_02940 [Pedosphaera sp.]|nr:hypothetical protein [Pedosphaera sp.]
MKFFVLIASILVGAFAVFQFGQRLERRFRQLNTFAGAYLLGLTCLALLPEVFKSGTPNFDPARIGAFVLAGFILQVILEFASEGIEHGHAHAEEKQLPAGLLIGLFLHSFLEATPLGNDSGAIAHDSQTVLLLGISVHNIPVSIVLTSLCLQCGISRPKTLLILLAFAAMAPLGVLSGGISSLASHHRELQGLVIGIFMHVATTILFESGEGHHYQRSKIAAIVVGLGLAIGTVLLTHH